jgi:multidrug resistance efflux pump
VAITLACVLGLAVAAGVAVSLITLEVTVDAAGTLEPVRVWPVRARTAGIVGEVLVSTGDTVRAGQPVVRLDSVVATLGLAQLEAQAAAQRLERDRLLQSAPIASREGETALAQASAKLLRARAAMRERLVEFGFAPHVDSVLAAYVRGTHVALDAAIADAESATGEVTAARAQIARAALAPIDAARQLLEQRRIEAQVAERRIALARGVLTTSAAGVVLTEQIERLPGASVREGDVVIEVADVSAWRATALVRDRDVHRVRVGDRAVVDILPLAALSDGPVSGRVVHVAAQPLGIGGTNGGAAHTQAAQVPSGLRVAPDAYRVVLALDRAQVNALGGGMLRSGYNVRATIVTRRVRVFTLLREWIADVSRTRV